LKEFPTTLSRLNQKNSGRGLWITLLVKTSRKRTSAALLLFKKIYLGEQQNRTIHLLQNRTILFVDNRVSSDSPANGITPAAE